jgi:hypothetical protein
MHSGSLTEGQEFNIPALRPIYPSWRLALSCSIDIKPMAPGVVAEYSLTKKTGNVVSAAIEIHPRDKSKAYRAVKCSKPSWSAGGHAG